MVVVVVVVVVVGGGGGGLVRGLTMMLAHAKAPCFTRPRLPLYSSTQETNQLPPRGSPCSLTGSMTSPACSLRIRSWCPARCQAALSASTRCPPTPLTCAGPTQACSWTPTRSSVSALHAARSVVLPHRLTLAASVQTSAAPRAPADGVVGGPAGAQPDSCRCGASAPSCSRPGLALGRPSGRPLLVPDAAHRLHAGAQP